MKDILITLTSYPDPTPLRSLESGVALAQHLDAAISGAMCQVGIPQISNYLADRLVGAKEAIAEENRKSRSNAQSLIEALQKLAGPHLAGPPLILEFGPVIEPSRLAEHARLFDLTIVPAYGHPDTQGVAEALIFGSGRPVLLLPSSESDAPPKRVVVAWDGSRGAARAANDALPFLRRADSVEVVSVTGEKALPASASMDGLILHLQRHGIAATAQHRPLANKDVGSVLLNHAEEAGADLLVMGAYGRSRLREFILGGATATILASASIPVLFAL